MVEQFVPASGGVALWTVAEGDGPLTLLLSNGGAGLPDYLAPLAALIAGNDIRVVRWEQRGVGRSGGDPAGPFTIADCLADIEVVRSHYRCERWVIGGHSWGADLALIYALAYPARCAGLLCVAGGRLNNDREWHAAYRRGRDARLEPPLPDDLPPNLTANKQLSAEFKRYVQRPTLWREVASLAVPALFLYGSEDIRPSWAVEQVAVLLPAAHFVLLSGANHYPYLSHPAEVRAHAGAFLRSLPNR